MPITLFNVLLHSVAKWLIWVEKVGPGSLYDKMGIVRIWNVEKMQV